MTFAQSLFRSRPEPRGIPPHLPGFYHVFSKSRGERTIQFLSSANQAHTNLVRLNVDGSVDDGFVANINGAINCLALQTNGQILVGGEFMAINGTRAYSLGRLNADGTVDPNFNAGCTGPGDLGPDCIQVQPDGKILAGGLFDRVDGSAHTNLFRLNSDGSLDTNYEAQAGLWKACIRKPRPVSGPPGEIRGVQTVRLASTSAAAPVPLW